MKVGNPFTGIIQRIRKLLFWAHLIFGLAGALFIFCLAFSGICIAYESAVLEWLNRRHDIIFLPKDTPRDVDPVVLFANDELVLWFPSETLWDIETLLRRLREHDPQFTFSDVCVWRDPKAAVRFSSGKSASVFVNPYTGDIVGQDSGLAEAFFKAMTGFHRSLALPGGMREIGHAITGAACLACFSLVLTGLYLWLPRRWSVRSVEAVAFFNTRLTGKARNFNWHNVTGLWLAPVLVVMTLTGLVLGYGWANDAVFRMAGSPPEPLARLAEKPGERGKGRSGGGEEARDRFELERNVTLATLSTGGLGEAVRQVQALCPDWTRIEMRFTGREPLVFRVTTTAGPSHAEERFVIHRETYALLSRSSFEEQSRGAQWVAWIRDIHTGQAGGLLGETLAVVGAGGLIVLVWTGVALSWQRFVGARQARRRSVALVLAQTALSAEIIEQPRR